MRCFQLPLGQPTVLARRNHASHIVSNVTISCTAECLDSKRFTLLHLRLILAFDNRHAFAPMYRILDDIVPVEISDAFYWKNLPTDFDFVALHGFLDGRTDVAHPNVDAGLL